MYEGVTAGLLKQYSPLLHRAYVGAYIGYELAADDLCDGNKKSLYLWFIAGKDKRHLTSFITAKYSSIILLIDSKLRRPRIWSF